MHSLHELQKQFTELLTDSSSHDVARDKHDALNVQSPRARIYRNSVAETMRAALAAAYPVVARLVGEECFRSLATRYTRDYPSTSGNIQDFGANLSTFIEALPELSALPYLSDVARLEWLIQEACRAAEARPTDLATLSNLSPASYGELHFSLPPSARLLCSSYPVLRIWQNNHIRHELQETISLDEGGDLLLVIRRNAEIEVERLGLGEFTLLCQLEQGHSLECAVEKALIADPLLDLVKILSNHLARRMLVVERRDGSNLLTYFDHSDYSMQLGLSA